MNVSEEDLPNKWVRKMPQPWAEDEHGNPIHNIPRTRWACSVCKIYLCKDAFAWSTSAALLPLSRSKLDRVKIYVYRPTGSTERCATEGATTVPPHTTLGQTTSAQSTQCGRRGPKLQSKVRAGGQIETSEARGSARCAAGEREVGSMQSTCKVRNPPRAIHSLRYTAVAVLRPNMVMASHCPMRGTIEPRRAG